MRDDLTFCGIVNLVLCATNIYFYKIGNGDAHLVVAALCFVGGMFCLQKSLHRFF